jgi:hypothetical protein
MWLLHHFARMISSRDQSNSTNSSSAMLRRPCWLATGGSRRGITGYAVEAGVGCSPPLEPRYLANDHGTGACHRSQSFAHICNCHAGLLGNFDIQPLTVFSETFHYFHDVFASSRLLSKAAEMG